MVPKSVQILVTETRPVAKREYIYIYMCEERARHGLRLLDLRLLGLKLLSLGLLDLRHVSVIDHNGDVRKSRWWRKRILKRMASL